MTRFATASLTAFFTVIGCAEEDVNVDSAALSNGNENSDANGQGDTEPSDEWYPAALQAGAYMMTVRAVHDTNNQNPFGLGAKRVVYITELDGVPMLFGTAPVLTDGSMLEATHAESAEMDEAAGECKYSLIIDGYGKRTGPDQFVLDLIAEDIVSGEGCADYGFGKEREEYMDYTATFEFIPAESDAGKDRGPERPFVD